MDDGSLQETRVLVAAAQRGDRQALEDLFSRYLPRVERIVALRLGRSVRSLYEDDDVVQAAFVKVVRGLPRYVETTPAGFRNWLARCVEREIVDLARSSRALKRGRGLVRRFTDLEGCGYFSSIVHPKQPSPSEVAQARELEDRIESSLLTLPEHYREVIVLRHLCDMSFAQIAREMGFGGEAAARNAFSRALRKLRQALGIPEVERPAS